MNYEHVCDSNEIMHPYTPTFQEKCKDKFITATSPADHPLYFEGFRSSLENFFKGTDQFVNECYDWWSPVDWKGIPEDKIILD